jgi:hypothetical protein
MEQVVIESQLLGKWLRPAFLDDDGQVFLPCGAFANELRSLLCLAHDGVPMVRDEGHIYAPASWLAEEHPGCAEAIGTIAANVRKARGCRAVMATEPGST